MTVMHESAPAVTLDHMITWSQPRPVPRPAFCLELGSATPPCSPMFALAYQWRRSYRYDELRVDSCQAL